MARPIDAVKTAEIISEHFGISLDDLCDVFAAIPTEDVQPVVHAKWAESHNLDDCFWICSECKFCSMATLAPKLYNYCPNCGARMDGES